MKLRLEFGFESVFLMSGHWIRAHSFVSVSFFDPSRADEQEDNEIESNSREAGVDQIDGDDVVHSVLVYASKISETFRMDVVLLFLTRITCSTLRRPQFL